MKRKWRVAGALALVELALCAGMYGIVQTTTKWANTWRPWLFEGTAATAQTVEEQHLAVTGPAVLTIDNSQGPVHVQTGADGEITVIAHKQVWASTPDQADAALAVLTIGAVQDGNQLQVRPVSEPATGTLRLSRRAPTVELTITVPASTVVTARTRFSDILLAGTNGAAELTTDHGSISVNHVDGNLTLHSEYGNITAQAVRGQINADAERGSIRVEDLESDGTVLIVSEYGSVALTNGRTGAVTIQAGHAPVTLQDCTIRGPVTVRGDYGAIMLTHVTATEYNLENTRADITVDGARATVTARSDSGDVTITNGEDVTLGIKTNRGTLRYDGSLGSGPHTLQTLSGAIRLALAHEIPLTIDLATRRGRIRTTLPVSITAQLDPTHWRGTLAGGGAPLTITSDTGNITLDPLYP